MIHQLKGGWKKRSVAIVTAFILGGLTTGIGYALGTSRTGTGAIARFDGVEVVHPQNQHDPICTSSTTYEDMPDMTRTFTQGGLLSNQTVVMFQTQFADTETGYANLGSIRLMVDGTAQDGSGADVNISAFSPAPSLLGRSWNFMSNALAPGSHTAKLQWKTDRSQDPEAQFCTQNRSMIVLHN